MSTNGVNNAEDADMADCDGEKVVTMMDVLQEQQDFEDDANAVLGASDDKNCTYSKGYIKRQAIYACVTCCSEVKEAPTKRAGVCLACSLNCHENHELIELYTKRNFRCDCGNSKFDTHPCQYTPNKSDLNVDNKYNQNFDGIYCTCHRPYPDPEITDEDEMIQCIICEDWLHASHLEAVVPGNDQYSEMICKTCMDNNEFLHDYSNLAVNIIDTGDVDITTVNSTDMNLGNGDILEDEITLSHEITGENITKKPANIDNNESSENTSIIEYSANTEKQHCEAPVKDDAPEKSKDIEIENKVTEEESLQDQTDSVSKDGTNTVISNSTEDTKEITTSESIENKEEASEQISCENMEKVSTQTSEPQTTTENIENNSEMVVEAENSNMGYQESESMETDQIPNEMESTKSTSNIEPSDQTTENKKDVKLSDEDTNEKSEVETSESNGTVKVSDKEEIEKAKDEISVNETIAENNGISNDDKSASEGDKDKSTTTLNGFDENDSIIEKKSENSDMNKGDNKIEQSEDAKLSHESVLTDQERNGDPNVELTEVPKNTSLPENGENENKINIESEEIKENKRKLSTEKVIDDTLAKKPKLDDKLKCIRPKGVKRLHKGAVFWPSNFRQKLCTCSECLSMYKDLSVLFLIDPEDTVLAYETLGKERVDGRTTQYEKGLEALSSLDRIQQINALTEYNKMRDKLLDYLKSFKDRKEIVKEEDIKAFFAGMKPKREPDGVYFCR